MKITKKIITDLVREMILEEITPKKAIEKEGGAIGLDMLADMTGMSKKELRDLIDKDPDLKKHADGDIIDASGLKEDIITEEDIDEILGMLMRKDDAEKRGSKEAEKIRMAREDEKRASAMRRARMMKAMANIK